MKSILVLVSGTSSDSSVLDAAYAIAGPRKAHLDFIHFPLASIEPADFNQHIEFARGGGLAFALKDKLPRSRDAETSARTHVSDFCIGRGIITLSRPSSVGHVTANWISCPIGPDADGLLRAARTHDLTVIGRSAGKRSWSQNLLERLTANSGRPVLIVPPGGTAFTLDTVVVWWKDHDAAARAVAAALPILAIARRVGLISVAENSHETDESVDDLANQLRWHGIVTTPELIRRDRQPTVDLLWSTSLAANANLVVMGGFSRPRLQEIIFGGCTQAVLEEGVRPVFLMH